MPQLQAPAINSSDPRWIEVRVSRINLAVSMVGALLAYPIMLLVEGMSPAIRIGLLLLFSIAMAWDLHLILLKGRQSVRAFYLFDRDPGPMAAAGAVQTPAGPSGPARGRPALSIRVRLARAPLTEGADGFEGDVLGGAFVSPWFAALRFRLPGDPPWRRWLPRIIPLWSDSIDADQFRRIRVLLKWK